MKWETPPPVVNFVQETLAIWAIWANQSLHKLKWNSPFAKNVKKWTRGNNQTSVEINVIRRRGRVHMRAQGIKEEAEGECV